LAAGPAGGALDFKGREREEEERGARGEERMERVKGYGQEIEFRWFVIFRAPV